MHELHVFARTPFIHTNIFWYPYIVSYMYMIFYLGEHFKENLLESYTQVYTQFILNTSNNKWELNAHIKASCRSGTHENVQYGDKWSYGERKKSHLQETFIWPLHFQNIFMYPEHFLGHNKSLLDCPQRLKNCVFL